MSNEHIPKYAAGCAEDNINTGKVWEPENKPPRKHTHTLLKVIGIILLIVFLNTFVFAKHSVQAELSTYAMSQDYKSVHGIIHVTNSGGGIITGLTSVITIQHENGTILGQQTVKTDTWLKKNDSEDVPFEISINPIPGQIHCKYSIQKHYFP